MSDALAMHLDSLTLIVIGNLSVALCGVFLLAAWWQMRRSPALLWWASANFALPASTVVTMAGVLTDNRYALLAGLVFAAAPPVLIWGGIRVFARGHVSPTLLVALGVGAAGFTALASTGGNVAAAMASFAVWVAFMIAASIELWLGPEEHLPARWPLMALFLLHGLIYSGGIFDFITGTLYAGIDAPRANSWFGLSYFETIVYSMGTAIFMSLLCKEREERRYIAAAGIDSLTGAASRGAFFERAARLLARCQSRNAPLSLIVFDLDRFKSINDAHGHAVGDQVLRTFADTVRGVLRPNDLFGRHGGEEFAVVLPGATPDTAYVIAERVRNAFADSPRRTGGPAMKPTVSAGVATATRDATFEQIMIAADMAMYRAKELGRNRVQRHESGVHPFGDKDGESDVTRVA